MRRQEESFQALQQEKTELQSILSSTKAELSAAVKLRSTMVLSLESSKQSLEQTRLDLANLQEKYNSDTAELKEHIQRTENERNDIREKLQELQLQRPQFDTKCLSQSAVYGMVDDTIVKDLQDKLAKSEQIRKKLQNKVHELKGNVRVFVRCRPFLQGDEEFDLCSHSGMPPPPPAVKCCEEANVISLCGARSGIGGVVHTYSFDQVFQESSSQDKVFDSVSDLIQSALDGYRVCVFAYGQTGSGETC